MPGRRGDDDLNIVVATIGQRMRGQDDSVASNLVSGTLGAAHGRNRGLGQENEIGLLVFGGNNTSGERSGNAPLTAHPTGRYDFETENLVVATLNSGGNNGGFRTEPGQHLVYGALSATHGGPDDNDAQAGHLIAQFDGHSANGVQECVGVANTLDCDGRDGVIGGFGVRRLTPIECERLQGFPDDWTTGQSDSARYRQLGNAVAVPVAEWIGRRILAVYGAAGG